jgi:hypothetical protein
MTFIPHKGLPILKIELSQWLELVKRANVLPIIFNCRSIILGVTLE